MPKRHGDRRGKGVGTGAAQAARLAARIASSTRSPGGKPCSVCTLPPPILTVIDALLAKPANARSVSYPQLVALLKDEGFVIGQGAVQKHAALHLKERH